MLISLFCSLIHILTLMMLALAFSTLWDYKVKLKQLSSLKRPWISCDYKFEFRSCLYFFITTRSLSYELRLLDNSPILKMGIDGHVYLELFYRAKHNAKCLVLCLTSNKSNVFIGKLQFSLLFPLAFLMLQKRLVLKCRKMTKKFG